jgi:hypothetical protein
VVIAAAIGMVKKPLPAGAMLLGPRGGDSSVPVATTRERLFLPTGSGFFAL